MSNPRKVIDAIMQEHDNAAALFNQLMAENIKRQLADMKEAVGKRMFESTNAPIQKQDWTVEAIDPAKATAEMPEGMPIKYKVNSYGASNVYRTALENGHKNIKVIDSTGCDVTPKINESTAPGMEDWIKSNKDEFVKRYGKEKGLEVLYATAWKMHNKKKDSINESDADDVEVWKQKVKDAYPAHAAKLKFKSADQGKHINASHPDHPDRSFGVYDVSSGKGHVLGEGTESGTVNAEMTAQLIQQKEQENLERKEQASQAKAPTIDDVVSVLGNTTAVNDTAVA